MKILKRFKKFFLLSLLIPFLLINGASSFAEENQTGEAVKVESLEFKRVEKEKTKEKTQEITKEKSEEKAKTEENGNVVYSFTSKSTPEEINGILKAGKKYILREKKAIDGYKKAEDIEFTVNSDGKEQEIKVINEKEEPKPKTPPEKPNKPKGSVPKTNIKSGIMIFSSLLLVSGVVGSIIFYKKRKEK